MTRGLKLNNPGNIEKASNIPWQGLVTSGPDAIFCEFSSPIYGLRALFLDIKNNINKRYDTIFKLITKYAPPSENDTVTYIHNVTARTGLNADTILQYADVKAVGLAIIWQEQGSQPYDDETVQQALVLAGLPSK